MVRAARQLHNMNGDELTRLKRPLCSELGTALRGSLNARKEEHRKRVELMFKDRNIVLNKLKRAQDAVYKTLLRVNYEKKMMDKELYKKHQEELRDDFRKSKESFESTDKQSKESIHEGNKAQNTTYHDGNTLDMKTQGNKNRDQGNLDLKTQTAKTPVRENVDTVPNHPTNTNKDTSDSKTERAKNAGANPQKASDESYTPNHAKFLAKEPKIDENTSSVDNSTDYVSHVKSGNVPIIPKARVLEVRKDRKTMPLVRERSALDDDKAATTTAQSDPTKKTSPPQPLPHINFPNINRAVFPDNENNNTNQRPSNDIQVSSGVPLLQFPYKRSPKELPELKHRNQSKPPPPKSYLMSLQPQKRELDMVCEEQSCGGSTTVVDTSRTSRTRSSDHGNDIITAREDGGHLVPAARSWPTSVASSERGSNRCISLIELNRRKTAEREAKMREILNREPVVQYVLDAKRNVVPDINGFHRQTFQAPTMREKHQQHKMLSSELDATLKQRDRIESFFEKIDMENEEKAEQRRRHLAKLATAAAAHEESERESKRSQENLGSTLTQLMTAFNRPATLPPGVAPNSTEALEFCKYIRNYQLLNMDENQRREAAVNKISSWRHN